MLREGVDAAIVNADKNSHIERTQKVKASGFELLKVEKGQCEPFVYPIKAKSLEVVLRA
jgi:hypothetical protein